MSREIENYKLLKSYLMLDSLIDGKIYGLSKVVDQLISSNSETNGTAILFPVSEGKSEIGTLLSLLGVKFGALQAKRLIRIRGGCSALYGVYPKLDNPVFIFELNSVSSEYAEERLLPHEGGGLKGKFKRLTKFLLGFNPSVAAIVVGIK